MHEEVRRAPLSVLLDGVRADPPRGEIVLVVGGAARRARRVDSSELARRAEELMDEGVPRADALRRVARSSGATRRDVFDALVERRRPPPD
jgi:16S rRNA (cytidine1402-2'-O)-methyltransferase